MEGDEYLCPWTGIYINIHTAIYTIFVPFQFK